MCIHLYYLFIHYLNIFQHYFDGPDMQHREMERIVRICLSNFATTQLINDIATIKMYNSTKLYIWNIIIKVDT
jgi:hypothetical protein